MADANPQILGTIRNRPFETIGRNESWAEQRTTVATVIGKFGDLDGAVKPGDSMAQHANWFNGKFGANWYVKTIDLLSPDGVTGELKLSLQRCGQGKDKPYNITWDVAMEEVQMKLINHPSVIANCNIHVLLSWLDTPAGIRVGPPKSESRTQPTYYYYAYTIENNQPKVSIEEVKGEWNIAFCNAVTQGIETYNKYLPVIVKNSYYLELPGANYDQDHVITGGTISEFTGPDAIGRFNDPDLKISGYSSKDGIWFKNCDKFTSQPDGSWVRTEGWVFTNDPSHKWIYTGKLN